MTKKSKPDVIPVSVPKTKVRVSFKWIQNYIEQPDEIKYFYYDVTESITEELIKHSVVKYLLETYKEFNVGEEFIYGWNFLGFVSVTEYQ